MTRGSDIASLMGAVSRLNGFERDILMVRRDEEKDVEGQQGRYEDVGCDFSDELHPDKAISLSR